MLDWSLIQFTISIILLFYNSIFFYTLKLSILYTYSSASNIYYKLTSILHSGKSVRQKCKKSSHTKRALSTVNQVSSALVFYPGTHTIILNTLFIKYYLSGASPKISLASAGVATSLPSILASSTTLATIWPLDSARTPFSMYRLSSKPTLT